MKDTGLVSRQREETVLDHIPNNRIQQLISGDDYLWSFHLSTLAKSL